LATKTQDVAEGAQKDAAEVISGIGQQINLAGDLQNNAGKLYLDGANIFGGAADIENKYLSLTTDAYKHLSDAYKAAANYYLGAGELEVRANTSGGGGGVHGVQFSHVDLDNTILRPGAHW
jgi:hypothetical protein